MFLYIVILYIFLISCYSNNSYFKAFVLTFSFYRDLSNKDVLPYDVRRYATAIDTFIKSLKNNFGTIWQQNNVDIGKCFY